MIKLENHKGRVGKQCYFAAVLGYWYKYIRKLFFSLVAQALQSFFQQTPLLYKLHPVQRDVVLQLTLHGCTCAHTLAIIKACNTSVREFYRAFYTLNMFPIIMRSCDLPIFHNGQKHNSRGSFSAWQTGKGGFIAALISFEKHFVSFNIDFLPCLCVPFHLIN